ncbi:MAG TPA: PhoH family protein [Candidatus Limnocylindrales bacterium]|nr:PhoH family protein [Candidatus Limnocylindrales bacterium]
MFGNHDENVRTLERALGVRVAMTPDGLRIDGEDHEKELAVRVLRELYGVSTGGRPVAPGDVTRAIEILGASKTATLADMYRRPVYVSPRGKEIAPKTTNQRLYVDAIRDHDLTFGIGPAGTGKTYLAMAMAVADLFRGKYSRIILTRPAVEAGEKLGFLPGDLAEKVNPYLRPLYDALHDMVSLEKAQTMIERGTIEVAPLAFMRGRTLNNAFVILDEAQNTTREQMKMFLTRLGFESKAVVTGDITQVDLPTAQVSGLHDAWKILQNIQGIAFIEFEDRDVVRHPLVKRIITAYDKKTSPRRDKS